MMEIAHVPIDKVSPWDKNPRGIKTEDYDRLKKQILKHGLYKPLIAVAENGGYVVLGGNMRLRVLKEIGMEMVDLVVVKAESDAERIEISISDNDRAGYYEEQALSELVYPLIAKIDLALYKVDVGSAADLQKIIGDISDIKPQEFPEIIDDSHECPKCGYKW
jgi:hypothetical protein